MPADREANQEDPKPRVFVIRDFSIKAVKMTLAALVEDHPDVAVPGLDDSALGSNVSQGQVFRDVVQTPLADAEAAIALVDEPNANVGFELGYAVGLGKRVALVCAGAEVPDWLKIPPLNGFLAATSCGIKGLEAIVTGRSWIGGVDTPTPGSKTLLLCPDDGGEGTALRSRVEKLGRDAALRGWRTLPANAWSLYELPQQLQGVGKVVWVLAPYPQGTDRRDGQQNAAAAVVAGYALACGLPVRILRHDEFRARDKLIDVVQWEKPFGELKQFVQLLHEIDAELPVTTRTGPLAAYCAALRREHAGLVKFFPQASDALLDEVYVELDLALDETRPIEARGMRRLELPGRPRLRDLLRLGPDSDLTTGRWVVLGDPGAGKSTLARHLAWELAGEPDGPLPVYVPLAGLPAKNRHPFWLAERKLRDEGYDVDGKGLEDALAAASQRPGGVWILLDGLDEVGPEQIGGVREFLAELATDEALRAARLVVLSRSIGYRDLGPAFRTARLRPLQPTAQEDLLKRWLGPVRGRETWRRIGSRERLRELAGNPLLLTLVASLALDPGRGLPDNRVRLYDAAIDLLLTRGYGLEPEPIRAPTLVRRALQELALVLQESESATWTEEELVEALHAARCAEDADTPMFEELATTWANTEEFLRDVAARTGIVAPHEGSRAKWRFLHRQFREFLAAEALQQRGQQTWMQRVEDLEDEEGAIARWAETMGLLCGLVEDPLVPLAALREASSELALRALAEVDNAEPDAALTFLVDTEGWDGDHLLRLTRSWGVASDRGRERAADRLWQLVTPGRPIEQLAGIHHTLAAIGAPPARERFFRQCELWPDQGFPAIDFVQIPAGTFAMGSPEDEDGRWDAEGPVHEVDVPAFELATTPVRVRDFARFDRSRPERDDRGEHPVAEVSWWDAYLFCTWLGARLPSEAEWEYACRAGTQTRFWSGDAVEDLTRVGWFDANSGPDTHPVTQKPVNPLGLFDMHGNVWEWCRDEWHQSYEGAPRDGSAWLDGGGYRVVRGGSWFDPAWNCRSAIRDGRRAGSRTDYVGFRPARSSLKDFTPS
ncbi:MAG: SUMF1/EgtB/PvdO family nonheme iron enzyme [Planctomycetes bacterium]|nr:SUMF1/EgtB/PvdO family nonheme iron enzyme [Planctomycetota bacterium]